MVVMPTGNCGGGVCGGGGGGNGQKGVSKDNQNQILAYILAVIRKSLAACRFDGFEEPKSRKMEIGWPTDVQHLTHVTFDRFHGFLGLPVEFQVEVPCKVPSASVSVFGVSAESMQCSYDSRGNSVPTILLLMQERLYAQGGLKAEGIFRINPENSHEEHVRDQLNRGNVPKDIEVHCLAGLIKAWFRELPCGILDGLSPDEVLNCNTEEERVELVKQLKPTETALLNWAVDLMSDVAEQEELNKMNARNIAMVFAPNMTQTPGYIDKMVGKLFLLVVVAIVKSTRYGGWWLEPSAKTPAHGAKTTPWVAFSRLAPPPPAEMMSDPLTALMHAVQVMNLLKTLITKTLREREDTTTITQEFSPTWGPQTDDDEFNRQEETQTSCELRRQVSSEDEEEHEYTHDVNSGNETETLSEMEERFLKQIEKNKDAKDRFKKELELVTQSFSPTSGYDSKESETRMEIVGQHEQIARFNDY
ncbi:Rho GTPase-activating protein 2-like protein [Tanacetum coccineum]